MDSASSDRLFIGRKNQVIGESSVKGLGRVINKKLNTDLTRSTELSSTSTDISSVFIVTFQLLANFYLTEILTVTVRIPTDTLLASPSSNVKGDQQLHVSYPKVPPPCSHPDRRRSRHRRMETFIHLKTSEWPDGIVQCCLLHSPQLLFCFRVCSTTLTAFIQ